MWLHAVNPFCVCVCVCVRVPCQCLVLHVRVCAGGSTGPSVAYLQSIMREGGADPIEAIMTNLASPGYKVCTLHIPTRPCAGMCAVSVLEEEYRESVHMRKWLRCQT